MMLSFMGYDEKELAEIVMYYEKAHNYNWTPIELKRRKLNLDQAKRNAERVNEELAQYKVKKMTREEAYEIAENRGNYQPTLKVVVEFLSDLGILKFDDTENIQRKINEAVWSLWPAGQNKVAPMDIVDALDKAGLKIVRKNNE